MTVPGLNRNGSAAAVNYPVIIESNAQFPCDSLTCLTIEGRSPYCTMECMSDQSCPTAFSCQVVVPPQQTSANFAGRRFCVWRGCSFSIECGDVTKYDCIMGFYGPKAAPGLCGPKGG